MTDQQGREMLFPEPRSSRFAALRSRFRRGKNPPSLGLQLLVIVNGALAILLAAFLILDYRRELGDRLEQKRIALQEEAKTILPAVSRLHPGGAEAIQEYLDAVCGRMFDAESPGHHIAVDTGAAVIQSTAHGRSSTEIFHAMRESLSLQRAEGAGEHALVVGSADAGDTTVYVSENAAALRHAVFGDVLWRLMGIVALGGVAAAIASMLLLRMVARPVNQFVATVTAIAESNFGVRVRGAKSRELAALAVAIESMSRRLQATAEQQRAEMAKAREIQEHLLPASTVVPGMTLAALYRPATDVAGDYYDVISLPDGSWILCVADVCGHGVPAAMSAAMLKALLLNAAEHHMVPGELLVVTTDGVAEAWSPQGELFGRERLRRLVRNSDTDGVEEIVRRLDEALLAHQGNDTVTDDTTILAVEFAVDAISPAAAGQPRERSRSERRIEQGILH